MRTRILIALLVLTAIILSTLWLKQSPRELISLFPMQSYDQKMADWISPSNPDYDKPLLTREQQNILTHELYNHYFSSDVKALSPWNPNYINQILSKISPDDLATIEQEKITKYSNFNNTPANEIGYGANFHAYTNQ